MVHGERILVFSGEYHPFRLPVPGLWLDVFEKVKALGFSAVSFYVDWALLEGEPGVYRASGIFALEPFFEAASQAGIYLIARPGPVSHFFTVYKAVLDSKTVHQCRGKRWRFPRLATARQGNFADPRSRLSFRNRQLR
jgi:beta-galactosidase GanA